MCRVPFGYLRVPIDFFSQRFFKTKKVVEALRPNKVVLSSRSALNESLQGGKYGNAKVTESRAALQGQSPLAPRAHRPRTLRKHRDRDPQHQFN